MRQKRLFSSGLELVHTKRTNPLLLELMKKHYSEPGGFVGRNRCFAIYYDGIYYGHIVGGSATLHLPGRNEFFGYGNDIPLNKVINNIFYHIERVDGKYPKRNFTSFVVQEWRNISARDWEEYYGDEVIGFESLVELPRTGMLYKKDGWTRVGKTKGYTCKRVAGNGTDDWTGKRVWDTDNLRPKWVFCRKNDN